MFAVLLPGLAASVVGFGITVGIRKSWQERHQWAERPQPRTIDIAKELVTLFGVLIWLMLLLEATYVHLRIHYDLWALQPDDVQEIKVGEQRFTDQASIGQIVDALKSSEWYSVNHGGWGDETPIFLRMASGTQWHLRAGYHFAQHGAVVLRSSQPHGGGWALGEVFSLALPKTLEQLGVPLSRCDTAHGHPCVPSTTAPAL